MAPEGRVTAASVHRRTLIVVSIAQVFSGFGLAAGESGAFQMWDWVESRRSHTIRVPQRPFLIVEGVGVALPRARDLAVLTLFVTAPWETRLARGLARDANAYDDAVALWETFEQDEQSHHARTLAREDADILIDGTQPVPQ